VPMSGRMTSKQPSRWAGKNVRDNFHPRVLASEYVVKEIGYRFTNMFSAYTWVEAGWEWSSYHRW